MFDVVRGSMHPLSTGAIAKFARVTERRVLEVMRRLRRRGMVDCIPHHGELVWWVDPGFVGRKQPDDHQPARGGLDG
ncbi:MAG: hypothetical protein Q6353_014055 [Candidatus Sigynarchaeum springense]